jgi:hypothetical protein
VLDDVARRTVLRRFAVAGSVGVAGCSGEEAAPVSSRSEATATERPTGSRTPLPTDDPAPETATDERSCPEPTGLSSRWRRETGDRTFEPIVGDGTVYVGTGGNDGQLRALSLADGTDQGRTPAGGILSAPPALGPDTVYYADYGSVAAFVRSDGTERWRHGTTGDVPVPVAVDDDLVVVGESNHPTPQTSVDDQFDRVVDQHGPLDAVLRDERSRAVGVVVERVEDVVGLARVYSRTNSTPGCSRWSSSVAWTFESVLGQVMLPVSRTTHRPAKSERRTGSPSGVSASKSGASSPGFGPSKPLKS